MGRMWEWMIWAISWGEMSSGEISRFRGALLFVRMEGSTGVAAVAAVAERRFWTWCVEGESK